MSKPNTSYRATVLDEMHRAITNVAVPHHEPPRVVLRRRIVVAIVLVIGAVLLGFSLTRKPGDPTFYWLMLALGLVWIAGAFASGPLHLGGICWRGRNERPVITGTVVGLVVGGVFVLGGVIASEIPALADMANRVLQFASQGSLRLAVAIALVGAIAEELFYRGALYTALGRHYPVTISTIVYAGATMATGNPMLAFAAIVLGTVCAWERRATGGVLASMLTHLVWGLIMVLALPPLFGA